jgi:exosortase
MQMRAAIRPSRPIAPGGPASEPSLAGLLIDSTRGLGPAGALGVLSGLGLLAYLFAPTLEHFARTWSTDENYSHGFLVPMISLYFANEAARRGPIQRRGGVALGVSLILPAIAGRLATTLVPVGIISDLAFLLALSGTVAILGGRGALRRFGFALAFLVFMVPLPIALYSAIASPLQRLVSLAGSGVLNRVGVPVLCQGNTMTLPGGVQMFVAEACSGMRQLTGFLALTTAFAYLSARSAAIRAFVVCSSIPIALAANVLRVVLTGLIMYHVNPEFAMGRYHTAEGLLMMGVGLGLLAAECWLLAALFPGPRREEGRPDVA